MYDQTAEHLSRSGLYPLLQSAYRAGHSKETSLLKVQNDILLATDRHVTLLVLLDLSVAFDTVDHQVLLRRLEVTYGITRTALQWFRSYLTGRTQRVYINQTYSDDFALPHGVPQGSCLGLLLFTMYASKLFEVVKSHLPDVHAYADDTQIYLSFMPDSTAGEQDAARLVSNVAKYDHITPTLVKLHWLPVRFKVIFKIAMLAHKCIYGNAPEYLKGLVKVKRTSRYNLRSDGGLLLEDYSARSKKTLGDRAFKTAAPKIWNVLQEDIRMQDNYNIFKGQLKTHYYNF